MKDKPRQLDRVQRWMQQVIMHPDGIVAGIDSEEARHEIDIESADIEQVVCRSRSLTSIERLQVYGNAYYARLLECLRNEFPATTHAVGEDVFDGFAFGYLQAGPSQSYTLAHLGAKFPRYLAETSPAVDADDAMGDWPGFLVDLATLERCYSEVFDGPGVEGESLLQAEALQSIPAEQWPDARIQTVACLRLMSFQFPVHEYASAVRRNEEPTLPTAETTYLAITRRDYVVRRTPMSRVAFELLRALSEGQSLGEAIEFATGVDDDSVDQLANSLQVWFRDWAAAGYFQTIERPEDEP